MDNWRDFLHNVDVEKIVLELIRNVRFYKWGNMKFGEVGGKENRNEQVGVVGFV